VRCRDGDVPLIPLVAVVASSDGLSMTQKAADVSVQTLHPRRQEPRSGASDAARRRRAAGRCVGGGGHRAGVLTWNDTALLTSCRR